MLRHPTRVTQDDENKIFFWFFDTLVNVTFILINFYWFEILKKINNKFHTCVVCSFCVP